MIVDGERNGAGEFMPRLPFVDYPTASNGACPSRIAVRRAAAAAYLIEIDARGVLSDSESAALFRSFERARKIAAALAARERLALTRWMGT